MHDLKFKSAGVAERPAVQVALLALIAVAVYSNTFQVPFVFDDTSSITDNPIISNLANFAMNGYESRPNRFIGYLTFALNYHFGGLNVVGYHVVNLVIHIANALLVYALVRLTLRTPCFGTRDSELGTRNSKLETRNFLPFLAALLFVVHPVQTQAVTYIVQRLTSLAAFFYLASLVLHIRWRLSLRSGAPFSSRSVLPFYLLSLITAILAMKTKEIAFTLPLVLLLYEFSFFGRPHLREFSLLAPILSTIAIVPLTMVNLHRPVAELLADVHAKTVAADYLTRGEYLYTQFCVIVTYLRLLLLPINQNLDYDYPVSHSLLEPRTLLSFMLLMALLGSAVWLWRRSIPRPESRVLQARCLGPSPELRLVAFGIFWFFITLAVESSVIPIADVINEHRVYLASVGFFIALGTVAVAGGLKATARIPTAGSMAVTATAVVVLLLAGATYARNQVWKDEESIWQDARRKSPLKSRPYAALGAYYAKQKRDAEAINELEAAIRLNPKNLDALYNVAQVYFWVGRMQDAERVCRTLMELDPETFRTLDTLNRNK